MFPPRILALILFGGFSSAALESLVAVYPLPGAAVLASFSLLPLFLVGLSLGVLPLYGAACIAVASTLLLDTPLAALQSLLSIGLGPVLFTNRALLHRSSSSGETIWYPSSELLKIFVMVLGGVLLVAFGVYFYTTQGEPPHIYVHKVLETVDPQQQLREIEPLLASLFTLLPGVFAISWGITVFINGAIAQGILVRFNKNLRPSPSLEKLTLSPSFSGLFAVCLLGSVAHVAYIDILARNVACVLSVPFFLVGLGVVHRWIHKTSYATIALTFFYLLLFFFWPALIVMGIGMLKPWIEKFT